MCQFPFWNVGITLTCLIMLIQDKASAGVSYKKVGCYKDNGQKPRPLPQLLFTDRDDLSPVYSGRKFIKESFDGTYLDDLVGRCASKCKQLGYDVFGIEKFAECWSGDGAFKTYKNDGPTKQCYTSKYEPCNFECESEPCSGSKRSIFVYKLGTPSKTSSSCSSSKTSPRLPATIPTKSTQPTRPPSKRKHSSTRSILSRPTKLPSRGRNLPTKETLPTTQSTKVSGCCTGYTPMPSVCPPQCQTSCTEVCPSTCCVSTPLQQLNITVYSSPVSPLQTSPWCPYPCSPACAPRCHFNCCNSFHYRYLLYIKRKVILGKRKGRNLRQGRYSLLHLKRSLSNKGSGHVMKRS